MSTQTAAQSVVSVQALGLRRFALEAGFFLGLAGLTAWSAVLAKEATSIPPLANFTLPSAAAAESQPSLAMLGNLGDLGAVPVGPISPEPQGGGEVPLEDVNRANHPVPADPICADTGRSLDPDRLYPPGTRFFNGRPIRPSRSIWMTVTAYSPDERSCGDSADGITATLHSVHTNGHRLVAADPRVLRYGSMITVPGYDSDRVVPVLDCGGKIKGHRLDVLFPTHEQAVRWGVKRLRVTVWEYADGKPPENPRKVR